MKAIYDLNMNRNRKLPTKMRFEKQLQLHEVHMYYLFCHSFKSFLRDLLHHYSMQFTLSMHNPLAMDILSLLRGTAGRSKVVKPE